ncbi:hypothetical protein HPC49_47615 [Pyxidicoccus fallax]|uniref:Uncharacterized protein n=1 Tax=Pyxidicoccus fallax TaxID=394095 RepID=A0A848LXG9_9BACT|nr:hypothetical protein [Pyxidicoccus fallax]NMO22300.1 hypothetical protein [Pyxidicoccus fallax]NPC85847.1 hypothetical protein [Pyxidicoccus fallax]
MGVIRCPIHGLVGIASCCGHLQAAVEAERNEPLQVFLDSWQAPNFVCEPCYERASAILDKKEPLKDGFFLDLISPPEVYCSWCVDDWCERTGQGSLLDHINQARSKVGLPPRSRTPRRSMDD